MKKYNYFDDDYESKSIIKTNKSKNSHSKSSPVATLEPPKENSNDTLEPPKPSYKSTDLGDSEFKHILDDINLNIDYDTKAVVDEVEKTDFTLNENENDSTDNLENEVIISDNTTENKDVLEAIKAFSVTTNTRFQSIAKTVSQIDPSQTIQHIKEYPKSKKIALKSIAVFLFLLIIVISILLFSHNINSQNKNIEKFNNNAGTICTDYITKYGAISYTKMGDNVGKDLYRLTGLCYVREMDFDNDGTSELMLCYNDNGAYMLEVWGYNHKDKFVKLYSHKANTSNNKKDGSWVVFYHDNNKYLIGENSAKDTTKVTLMAKKGNGFEKKNTCDYDIKNEIFSINNKIDPYSFEKIKLSCISSTVADTICDTISNNLDSFGSVSKHIMENKTNKEALMMNAYTELIDEYNQKYGFAKYTKNDNINYIDGLAVVKQIDFDFDGTKELMLIYRRNISKRQVDDDGNYIAIATSTYYCDIYHWTGQKAIRVFQQQGLTGMLNNDTDVMCIIKNENGKHFYCTNSYDVENYGREVNAISKILKFDGSQFKSVFKANYQDDYGYSTFYINDEKVTSSDFDDKGYQVPYFTNYDSYDKDLFTVTYLQRRIGAINNMESTVDDTVKEITKINPQYTPEN